MGERGGEEDNLRRRLIFDPIEDLGEAHRALGITKHHTGRRVIQSTWRGMCAVMLTLEMQDIQAESIRSYQAEKLGNRHGDTFLLELMPIPRRRSNVWEYRDVLPQFASAEDYRRRVLPVRVRTLRDFVLSHQPEVVIAYGKRDWDSYKVSFRESM